MIYKLKIWPQFFKLLVSGRKNFEVRKNDRNFQAGDSLVLQEYDPVTAEYTGRHEERIVEDVFSLMPFWSAVVLTFKDKRIAELEREIEGVRQDAANKRTVLHTQISKLEQEWDALQKRVDLRLRIGAKLDVKESERASLSQRCQNQREEIKRLQQERDALESVARRFIEASGKQRKNPTTIDDDFANVAQAVLSESDNYRHECDALAAVCVKLYEFLTPEQKRFGQVPDIREALRRADVNIAAEEATAILAIHDSEQQSKGAVEALRPYTWRPIEEAHEDYGEIVLVNANDPGDVRLSHVCALSWDEDSKGMTHFARVPAFEHDPAQLERGEVKL